MKTIIKFSMKSCVPCQQLKPIFEDVVGNLTDIKVVEIDVEEHPDITSDYRDWETDRKSTRLNSSHSGESRMPSSA